MKRFIFQPLYFILFLSIIGGLIGCNGGGGDGGSVYVGVGTGSSTGGTDTSDKGNDNDDDVSGVTSPSFNDLADHFVAALNNELYYNATLHKLITRQPNHILIEDHDVESVDAFNLFNYDTTDDIGAFVAYLRETGGVYENLDYLGRDENGEDIYEDPWKGITFEDTHLVSRSPSAVQAHAFHLDQEAKARTIESTYGLSYERAKQLVIYEKNYQALKLTGALTMAEYNELAMAVVGSPATELMQIETVEGVEEAFQRAADVNDIGVERAKELFFDLLNFSVKI